MGTKKKKKRYGDYLCPVLALGQQSEKTLLQKLKTCAYIMWSCFSAERIWEMSALGNDKSPYLSLFLEQFLQLGI